MSSETKPDWIGVDAVADELSLSRREAWELVRRIGVPMLEAGNCKMDKARFRRLDWEDRRDAAVRPPEPRRRYTVVTDVPPPAKPNLMTRANKLRNA